MISFYFTLKVPDYSVNLLFPTKTFYELQHQWNSEVRKSHLIKFTRCAGGWYCGVIRGRRLDFGQMHRLSLYDALCNRG